MASLLEQYVEFLRDIHEPNVPEPFRAIILDKAIQIYYTAYSLAVKKDLKTKYRPLPGLNVLVSYEAATGYLRLAQLKTSPTDKTKSTIAKVKKNLAKLEKIPKSGVVTPIIFSVKERHCLADILAPELNVSFDLNGDNIIETTPWIKRTTAMLVWDPRQKGLTMTNSRTLSTYDWTIVTHTRQ